MEKHLDIENLKSRIFKNENLEELDERILLNYII